MLHASQLIFIHPITEEKISLVASWDAQWLSLIEQFGWIDAANELDIDVINRSI